MTDIRGRFRSAERISAPADWPDLGSLTPRPIGLERRTHALVIGLALFLAAASIGVAALAFLHPRSAPSGPGEPGLQVPGSYQDACARESLCLPGAHGRIPAALKRPLRLPTVGIGDTCPTTEGRPVRTRSFDGIALGTGSVRLLITTEGDPLHGTTYASPRRGWLAFQTLWFSLPKYQGPFVVRGERLDRPGPVGYGGDAPSPGPLVVPPGPTIDTYGRYRSIPGGLWVRAPGCYAWQVDGLGFSQIIVVRVDRRP